MNWITNIIEWIILTPLLFSSAYLFLFSLAALGKTKRPITLHKASVRKLALMVPAYKEDVVILATVANLLKQTYDHKYWDLVVIADSFKEETLDELRKLPLVLLEVSFEKSTKAKALNEAMRRLGDDYEVAVILDADNIAEPSFLKDIVDSWKGDTRAIQCHRTAKNHQTPTALLDAISEEVANHIFCKGHRRLGLSSRLVGSGMAFDYGLFKEMMSKIDAVGGFDKELEFRLLEAKYTIEYLPHVRVYDEKVSKPETMQRQRLRWIAAQYHYLLAFFRPSLRDFLRHGNVDFFDKALQMLLLPRMALVGLSFVGMVGSMFFEIPTMSGAWIAAFAMVTMAYLLGTPSKFMRWSSLLALLSLPKHLLLMLLGMRKIGTANKTFIHTPHGINH